MNADTLVQAPILLLLKIGADQGVLCGSTLPLILHAILSEFTRQHQGWTLINAGGHAR
jgi:hypothetical protein